MKLANRTCVGEKVPDGGESRISRARAQVVSYEPKLNATLEVVAQHKEKVHLNRVISMESIG